MTTKMNNQAFHLSEIISCKVIAIIESLPENFVSFDKDNIVFIIDLEERWLQQLSAENLNKLALALLLLKRSDMWSKAKDPRGRLFIQEFVKINQALKLNKMEGNPLGKYLPIH